MRRPSGGSALAPVVVDASVLTELVLGLPAAEQAAQVLSEWDLIAPSHLDSEVLSAIFGLLRAKRVGDERASLAVTRLVTAPVERVAAQALVRDALELRHNLSAYDALYVALARRLDCRLVTADRRMATAPGLGVAVTVVGG